MRGSRGAVRARTTSLLACRSSRTAAWTKLNAPFARQLAWFADLLTRYDAITATELKTGEPTALGKK
jgi:hypothetical protein